MHQDDINKDLKHYIHDKKKTRPFWNVFKGKKHEEKVHAEIKEDIENIAAKEEQEIPSEDKKALESMEEKIDDANQEEERVDEKREGTLKKFFKKLNFSKKDHDKDDEYEEPEEQQEEHQSSISDEEMKDFLKMVHSHITLLPSEKLHEFKNSKDFELYTRVLKEYDLIKK